jgi:hypothetical protein
LTHWRRFNRWSFKPSLIFFKSIRTSEFVNNFLKFLFHHLMNYLLRSLFNYFTTHPKNVNTKNKKTVTFFGDGWYCLGFRSTFTQYQPPYLYLHDL